MALHKGRFLWYENLKPRSYIEETSCCGTQGQTTQEILYVFYSEWDRPVNMSRAYLDGTNVMVFSSVLLGICIPKSWKCDCEDESDEPESCGKVTCLNTHFQCNNTRCIFHSWLCDGEEDCRDRSDETNPEACGKPGFRCGDTECEDIDECTPPGIYSQKCTNGKGFYRCSCSEGYTLYTDKKTCKAANHSLAYLVISNHRSILTADLNQRSLERVPVLVENVVATASDMKSGTVLCFGQI
ncbi:hypothetical protein Pmani_010046 [Petrolisthes manimaculis]|uniref:EGF-like domain-containing protein n=1 Tax=Petrolisthes manimaculis TaxID=1843537 RepID=A0AAE1Q2Y5_9EUCA|nr:hypothetical protein Pmani_010046 [Petrolisthes manimaculis]